MGFWGCGSGGGWDDGAMALHLAVVVLLVFSDLFNCVSTAAGGGDVSPGTPNSDFSSKSRNLSPMLEQN